MKKISKKRYYLLMTLFASLTNINATTFSWSESLQFTKNYNDLIDILNRSAAANGKADVNLSRLDAYNIVFGGEKNTAAGDVGTDKLIQLASTYAQSLGADAFEIPINVQETEGINAAADDAEEESLAAAAAAEAAVNSADPIVDAQAMADAQASYTAAQEDVQDLKHRLEILRNTPGVTQDEINAAEANLARAEAAEAKIEAFIEEINRNTTAPTEGITVTSKTVVDAEGDKITVIESIDADGIKSSETDIVAPDGSEESIMKNADGSNNIKFSSPAADGSKTFSALYTSFDGLTTVTLTGGIDGNGNVSIIPQANASAAENAAAIVSFAGKIPGVKVQGDTITVNGNTYEYSDVVSVATNNIIASKETTGKIELNANIVISSVTNSISTVSATPSHGFRSKKAFVQKSMRAEGMNERIPNVFNALAQNGPMVVDTEKFRFWLSPYASIANYGDKQSSEKGFGALSGVTYRESRYSVGVFFGYNTSKNEHNVLNKTEKTDGFTVGMNGSANLWKDGSFNFLYAYAPSTVKHKQNLGVMIGAQSGEQKNHAHIIDARLIHGFNFDQAYALDLELGNTSVFSKQGTYFGNASEIKGQSQEVYAGLALGWNKMLNANFLNVRASYDFGYQYKNSTKTPNTPIAGLANAFIPGGLADKKKTHYLGLSAGMLLSKSWKFDIGYNGAYAKKNQNHTVVAKIEYRM